MVTQIEILPVIRHTSLSEQEGIALSNNYLLTFTTFDIHLSASFFIKVPKYDLLTIY